MVGSVPLPENVQIIVGENIGSKCDGRFSVFGETSASVAGCESTVEIVGNDPDFATMSGASLCIELTPNEFDEMKIHKDTSCLRIVTIALSSPKSAVFSYSDSGDCWLDDDKRILQVQPLMGAR